MTVRELADVAGCSIRTVHRVIAHLFPGRMRNGVTTDLNENESVRIMAEVRKRGFMTPYRNGKYLPEIEKYFVKMVRLEK